MCGGEGEEARGALSRDAMVGAPVSRKRGGRVGLWPVLIRNGRVPVAGAVRLRVDSGTCATDQGGVLKLVPS